MTAKEIYTQLLKCNYCSKWNLNGADAYNYKYRILTLHPTFERVGMALTWPHEYEAQKDLPRINLFSIDGLFKTRYYLEFEDGTPIPDKDCFAKKVYEYCS